MKRLFASMMILFLFTVGAFAQTLPSYNFGKEQEKATKITVKAVDYNHFRKVMVYDVLPKYNLGTITTMTNNDQTEIGVFRHKNGNFDPDDILKDGAMELVASAVSNKDGTYDVYVKLDTPAKSKKLAKDVEKAFKKKPKK